MREARQRSLRLADPPVVWLGLAWILSGPLNPAQLIWVLGLTWLADEQSARFYWVVGLSSTLAVSLAYYFVRRRAEFTLKDIFLLALEYWLYVSVSIIALAILLTQPLGLLVAIIGTIIAALVGLPAALFGAAAVRWIAFRKTKAACSIP